MVYLIDSSIYVFRGWQSLSSSIKNTHGDAFNAVMGFTETVVNIIESQQPTWICAAFDTSNRNAIRYRIHPQYKANRSPSPPELRQQFAVCHSVCEAFNVVHLSHLEVEADDIIGQLSQCAHEASQPVTIVSADKDLTQFIRSDDIFWNHSQKTRSNYAQLKKRFGVKPEQMADLLALCGDKTDNIPGIPGVGAATAAKVLTKWGNLDGVFANIEAVAAMRFRGAAQVAKLIDENETTVRLARKLTGLIYAADLPNSLEAIRYEAPAYETCLNALVKIGFNESEAVGFAKRVTRASVV